jgi:hypothetical protein
MNGVFRDFVEKKFIVFLDNILIYTKTEEDHEKHMREVL